MSTTVATKGAFVSFAGGGTTVFAQFAQTPQPTPWEWVVLAGIVAACVISGALAAQAITEFHNGHDKDLIKRERRLRAMIFSAQFVFGMIIANQVNGELWITAAACLAVGWTGTQFLDWLASKFGFGGKK